MPGNSVSQPDRVAHDLGVLTQLDAAANSHRVAFYRAVNQDAPEDRDRVAGRTRTCGSSSQYTPHRPPISSAFTVMSWKK